MSKTDNNVVNQHFIFQGLIRLFSESKKLCRVKNLRTLIFVRE